MNSKVKNKNRTFIIRNKKSDYKIYLKNNNNNNNNNNDNNNNNNNNNERFTSFQVIQEQVSIEIEKSKQNYYSHILSSLINLSDSIKHMA